MRSNGPFPESSCRIILIILMAAVLVGPSGCIDDAIPRTRCPMHGRNLCRFSFGSKFTPFATRKVSQATVSSVYHTSTISSQCQRPL